MVVDPAADQVVLRGSVMRKSAEMHGDALKAIQPVVTGATMIARVKIPP